MILPETYYSSRRPEPDKTRIMKQTILIVTLKVKKI